MLTTVVATILNEVISRRLSRTVGVSVLMASTFIMMATSHIIMIIIIMTVDMPIKMMSIRMMNTTTIRMMNTTTDLVGMTIQDKSSTSATGQVNFLNIGYGNKCSQQLA